MKDCSGLVWLQFSFLMFRIVGNELFPIRIVEQTAVLLLLCPVAGDGYNLAVKKALIGVNAFAVFQQRPENTVYNDRVFMTQADQPVIVPEYGIRVGNAFFGVDFRVIRVDLDPGFPGGEARV